jgi:regulatory protein
MGKDKTPLSTRDRALGLLSRREHSARELKRKLVQKGVASDEAQVVVGEMGERSYQSDERFAGSLVRRRAASGYGPARVRAELAMHGIVRDAADQVLDSADVDWLAVARKAYLRRYGDVPTADRKERQMRMAWLANRGFDGATIRLLIRGDVED